MLLTLSVNAALHWGFHLSYLPHKPRLSLVPSPSPQLSLLAVRVIVLSFSALFVLQATIAAVKNWEQGYPDSLPILWSECCIEWGPTSKVSTLTRISWLKDNKVCLNVGICLHWQHIVIWESNVMSNGRFWDVLWWVIQSSSCGSPWYQERIYKNGRLE